MSKFLHFNEILNAYHDFQLVLPLSKNSILHYSPSKDEISFVANFEPNSFCSNSLAIHEEFLKICKNCNWNSQEHKPEYLKSLEYNTADWRHIKKIHSASKWHRFNLKRILQLNKKALSYDEWIRLLEACDFEDCDDDELSFNHDSLDTEMLDVLYEMDTRFEIENILNDNVLINNLESVNNEESDKKKSLFVHISCSAIDKAKNQSIQFSIHDFLFNLNTVELEKWRELCFLTQHLQQLAAKNCIVFLSGGGYFAGGIFCIGDGSCIVHKAFHKYTVRRGGSGSSQISHDKKRHAYSAGACIRRSNEILFMRQAAELFSSWATLLKTDFEKVDYIFCNSNSCQSKAIIVQILEPLLEQQKADAQFSKGLLPQASLQSNSFKAKFPKKIPLVLKIPFTTYRPSFAEVSRCFSLIAKVKISS